jgi:ubiquinone biosynthesis UbiH/UbiF/VisC/COQ6 family hydroxylase
MSAPHRREIFDAIIVGAGAVALFTALTLHRQQRRVLLLAAGEALLDTGDTLDARVYALAPDTTEALERCDVPVASLARVQSYTHMRVWDAAAELAFDAAQLGWPALGYIVEHRVLLAQLWAAVQRANISCVFAKAQLLNDARGSFVEAGDERLRAHLLLAADGLQSPLRAAAGISVKRQDYGQQALVFNVRSATQQHCAWQRFVEGSTLALLPLPGRYVNVVWSMPDAMCNRRAALSDDALLAELHDLSQARLGTLAEPGPRQSIALQQQHAERYVQDDVVLLGDAAHGVHPMAGQGLNLGLRDVLCLSEKLTGVDLQSTAKSRALRAYERERKSENQIALWGIHALQQMFQSERGLLAQARRLGLQAVQNVNPLKRLFAELAAGKTAGWP